MQVHVGEVRVGCTVDGPALFVIETEPVLRGEISHQLTPQAKALGPRTSTHCIQSALGAMDLPATTIGVQEQVEECTGFQQLG